MIYPPLEAARCTVKRCNSSPRQLRTVAGLRFRTSQVRPTVLVRDVNCPERWDFRSRYVPTEQIVDLQWLRRQLQALRGCGRNQTGQRKY